MLLLLQATQAADSVQVAADELMKEAIANADGLDKLSLITQQLIDFGIRAGERILIAVLVFVVGRFLISLASFTKILALFSILKRKCGLICFFNCCNSVCLVAFSNSRIFLSETTQRRNSSKLVQPPALNSSTNTP